MNSKRIYIVHGWDGYPEEGWFPWLKKELEAKGFEVIVPQLPQADEPRIDRWVPALAAVVGVPDEQTFFVGHSMGCQTVARYLASMPDAVQVGGAVFVAGFFKHLQGLEDDDLVRSMAHEWLDTPLDLSEVRKHMQESVAVFSDDGPYVPLDNQDDFSEKLGSRIIIEHHKGHFSGSTGTVKLPAALEALLSIIK